jgi:hypothetical protein
MRGIASYLYYFISYSSYIRMSHPGIRLCCSSLVNYFGNGVIQSLDYIRYLPGAYRPGSPNDAVIQ